jgi:tetratricopeptide (TPR) repeat protein
MFYQTQYARTLFFNFKEYEKAIEIADKQLGINPDHTIAVAKAQMLETAPYGDLVAAFKIRYERFKKDPSDRRFLRSTLKSARDLDLEPLGDKIIRTMQLYYSDTDILFEVLYWYYYKKEYTKAEELIDFLVEEERIDAENATYEKSWMALIKGNSQEALSKFERGFPDIANEEILNRTLNFDVSDNVNSYIEILRVAGRDEKANQYSTKLCEFYDNRIKSILLPADMFVYTNRLQCYYLSDDKTSYLNYLDDVFFNKKDRGNRFGDLKSRFSFIYENDPQFQKLYRKIETETHRMRAEVIAYLKEVGDWNEVWDKELGLE